MPDSFTHCLIGFMASSAWRLHRARDYVLAAALSLLPDLDSFTALHRSLTHSLLTLVPLFILTMAALHRLGYPRLEGAYLSSLPMIHVLTDLLTGGMPVRLFYPLSDAGYQLAPLLDPVVGRLLSLPPYPYYPEVVRVNMVVLALFLLFLGTYELKSRRGA